uniref:Uncharacterized protein n=1 Tax=Panagrolaimus superbus TaxID=310955 RepID=A0A914YRI1_9BILA
MSSKRLQIFHAHGIILGPLVVEKLAEKYYESLQELRISAACVHTPESDRYWNAISKFKGLKVLELPPSLFSISHPLTTTNLSILSTFKKLESLSVFICPNSGNDVGLFLTFLTKSLQKLMVRTDTNELPVNILAALNQQKIKLVFLPKKSYSFRWPFKNKNEYYQLFLKGFWEPPYFPETELVGVNLTPEIIRAQTTNWQCILPELKKIEENSMFYDSVETAQHKATDALVTAASSTQLSTIRTARERSPIVEHPDENNNDDHVIEELMHEMIERINRLLNEAEVVATGEPQTPPEEEFHTVRSTHSPLIRPATPPMIVSATNIAPQQELHAPLLPSTTPPTLHDHLQDGNSNYAFSPPTTTAISSENIPTLVEGLQIDVTQRSDVSSSQSAASVSNVSISSEQTSTASSIGTGWFV